MPEDITDFTEEQEWARRNLVLAAWAITDWFPHNDHAWAVISVLYPKPMKDFPGPTILTEHAQEILKASETEIPADLQESFARAWHAFNEAFPPHL